MFLLTSTKESDKLKIVQEMNYLLHSVVSQQKARDTMKTTNKTNNKTTENKTTTATTVKTNDLLDVTKLLNSIKFDANKYETLRCFDNEEFSVVKVERKSYALIRNKTDKRAVIKLWGHKDFVTCECSKMLRKRVDVSSDIYTSKEVDKNNNYKCKTLKDAIALCNDFIKLVDAQDNKVTVTEKKQEQKKEV